MPLDLIRDSSRRLAVAAFLLGAAFGAALLINNLTRAAGWPHPPRAHDLISVAMIAASAGFLGLARSGRLSPDRLLQLGLVYEVVVAFGISMGDHLTSFGGARPLVDVSWLCVFIVMFPLVVPARPLWSFVASLAAASTWPVAFYVAKALGQRMPDGNVVLLNFLENYIAAFLALAPTLIIRKLGSEVRKAREMGSYRLVERLDRGGMGEVWLASHRLLARPAAVKLIRPDVLGAKGAELAQTLVRRFEREAQATASLHSPHTIELYDFGITPDGTFYYVMEVLDGLDLDALVKRFGPVPAERALHLLLQACDSLADAHHAGLIHRDIKPANLFCSRRGLKYDFLKVLDFGLVKSSWVEESGGPHLTADNVAAGTPAFMAPEVVLGRPIDARVDLYGLGCVGYWLLTGKTVFEGRNALEVAVHHAQTTPIPPSQRGELRIPELLEGTLLDCLAKDPERRPASAQDLAERLSSCPLERPWTQERARQWWEARPAPAGRPERSSGSPVVLTPSPPLR